jgi:hypothetical protein
MDQLRIDEVEVKRQPDEDVLLPRLAGEFVEEGVARRIEMGD